MHINSMMIVAGFVAIAMAAAFGAVAIRHWRSQRRGVIEALGLSWDLHAALDLFAGLAITTIAMLGIFGCERVLGAIACSANTVAAKPALLQMTLILAGSAMAEELINRGLLLSGLTIVLGGRGRTAALLAALLFGLFHLANPGASALSVCGNALGGLIYGMAFVLSGRLWLPLGLHFAWNYVQGPLLGFPVSGLSAGGLLQIHDLGPIWLTGGSYGPEAGLVGILFRFLALALLFVWVNAGPNRRRRRDFADRNTVADSLAQPGR
jgi:membrane protease YdiL (CAAX protease family)